MEHVFHIFALVSTLVGGPVGPPGTPFGIVELQTVAFPDEASCTKAIKSAAFSPLAQELRVFLNSKVKPEYKDNLLIKFACSDKSLQELEQYLPNHGKDSNEEKKDDGSI